MPQLTKDQLITALRPLLHDVGAYSRVLLPAHPLRRYQLGPARAIARSIIRGEGEQFAVVFSRQAGKDESLAQLVAWLLTRYQTTGGSVVLAAPTLAQAKVSRDRLLARLRDSPLTMGRVRTSDGYIVAVGAASARFLSAAESANPRGQTASLLLVANEAQDIDPAIWDARFDPMAASTNATTLFMGTVWDRNGLLHRQMSPPGGPASARWRAAGLSRRLGGGGARRPGLRRARPRPYGPARRPAPLHPHRVQAGAPRQRGRALPAAPPGPTPGRSPPPPPR